MTNAIFQDFIDEGWLTVYMDDIVVHTTTEESLEDHQRKVHKVPDQLEEHNLYLRPSKCSFEQEETTFLGIIVSYETLAMDPKKLDVIANLLLPQHADELLYDPDCCSCGLEWRCIPHDACFIHDSCLCKGSGSFPPCKPQCPSWAQYSYDWYCELAASLSLHPHSLLPHFGSEVEPDVMFFGLSDPPS